MPRVVNARGLWIRSIRRPEIRLRVNRNCLYVLKSEKSDG